MRKSKIIQKRIQQACSENNVTLISKPGFSNPSADDKRFWVPLKFRCNECRHVYTTSVPNLYKKNCVSCPECKKFQRKMGKLELAERIAEKFGGDCTEHPSRVKSTVTRIKFKCHRGHTYYTSIQNHQVREHIPKCPKCKFESKFEGIKSFLKKHGVQCLTKEYKGIEHKMTFRCENNHTWESSFGLLKANFERNGVVCLQCKNLDKSDKYSRYGIELIEQNYMGHDNYMKWRCTKCNKTFEASTADMYGRQNKCPHCYKKKIQASKTPSEKLIAFRKRFKKAFGSPRRKKKPIDKLSKCQKNFNKVFGKSHWE